MGNMYNDTFYRSKSLRRSAKLYLKQLDLINDLRKDQGRKPVTHLLTRGHSGTAIASAMLALSDKELSHCIVRKHGESAHSTETAGVEALRTIHVIVDDFISTGLTIHAMVEFAKEHGMPIAAVIVTGGHAYTAPTIDEVPIFRVQDYT